MAIAAAPIKAGAAVWIGPAPPDELLLELPLSLLPELPPLPPPLFAVECISQYHQERFLILTYSLRQQRLRIRHRC